MDEAIEKKIAEKCDEWRKVIFSTNRVDREKAEEAVEALYSHPDSNECHRGVPQIIWNDSPVPFGAKLRRYVKENCTHMHFFGAQYDLMPNESAIYCKADDSEAIGIYFRVESKIEAALYNYLAEIELHVRNYIGSQSRIGLPSNSFGHLSTSLISLVIHEVIGAVTDIELVKTQESEKCKYWTELARHCSFGLAYPRAVFLMDNPLRYEVVNKNAQHRVNARFHCDGDAAIEWKYGPKKFYLNGIKVPEEYAIMPREEIHSKVIFNIKNVDIRREVVKKLGLEKVCADLKAKVIDKKGDYELLSLNLKDGQYRPFLKMKNPSVGTYHVEGVHPNCNTVEEALAWRNQTHEYPREVT